jgi:hypothetical protein
MPVHTYDEKALGGRTAVNLMRRVEIDRLVDGKREKVAAKNTSRSARFVPPPATGPSGGGGVCVCADESLQERQQRFPTELSVFLELFGDSIDLIVAEANRYARQREVEEE